MAETVRLLGAGVGVGVGESCSKIDASAVPIGTPKPVHGSGPTAALKSPFEPWVMSKNALGFSHIVSPTKPRPLPNEANKPE